MANVSWWYFFSKIIDLADTVRSSDGGSSGSQCSQLMDLDFYHSGLFHSAQEK